MERADLVSRVIEGPVTEALADHVADPAARQRVADDAARKAAVLHSAAAGEALAAAEIASEHWLTRSWRPLLMLALTGILVLVGVILPLADLIAGHTIAFVPRWTLLPEGFWEFLTVGTGGYIGGRSVEKVAGTLSGSVRGRRKGA